MRLHGPDELYASPYPEPDLARWAERIRVSHRGDEPQDAVRISSLAPPVRKERDVCVYFDNTAAAHAPADAQSLMERLRTP